MQTDAVIKCDVGISVSAPCDACTQTPVDVEVQTDIHMNMLSVSCIIVTTRMNDDMFTDAVS